MTVQVLTRLLAQYSPDLRVVVNGYEEGYDDLSPEQFSVVKISLNTGANPWEGQHGDPEDRRSRTTDGVEVVDALVLRRVSN